jgi:hypothetical protein
MTAAASGQRRSSRRERYRRFGAVLTAEAPKTATERLGASGGIGALAVRCAVALIAVSTLACTASAPHVVEPALAAPAQDEAAPPARATVPSGRTRDVSAHELRVVESLMKAAERVRGLRFVRPVPVLVQDADAIMAYVDSQVEEAELERARLVYTALGLLPAELDVRALLLRLMGEQVVGYYDIEAHRLIVRDDVMKAFEGRRSGAHVDVDEARVVLVHELVHALQDQHLGLSANIDKNRDSDAESAYRALIEGDATLAMIAFAHDRDARQLSELTSDPASVRNLSALVRSSPLAGSELGSAPAIVRVPLLSAYVDGLGFAANLHGDGGWGRVDRAHADPPVSTEQVLHPERFVHHDAPLRLRLPEPATTLGDGFELVHEDTLGELELGVYFGLGGNAGARAAIGWAGDRLYALRDQAGETAIVWLTAWDDEERAVRALRAAERVQSASDAALRAQQLLVRNGRALLIARGVPAARQPPLRVVFERWSAQVGLAAKPAD